MKKLFLLLTAVLMLTSCFIVPTVPSGEIILTNPTDEPIIAYSDSLNDGVSFRIPKNSSVTVPVDLTAGRYISLDLYGAYYRGTRTALRMPSSEYRPSFVLTPRYARFAITNNTLSSDYTQFYLYDVSGYDYSQLSQMFYTDPSSVSSIYTYDAEGRLTPVTQALLGYGSTGYIYIDSSIISRPAMIIGISASGSYVHSRPTSEYKLGNTYRLYTSNLVN